MPSKNAARRGSLPKRFSKKIERQSALTCVLLLSGSKGEAVSWALQTFGAVDGFHVLRKLSCLEAVFPEDAQTIARFLSFRQQRKLTVYTDRCKPLPCSPSEKIKFPPFAEIASLSEQVRCYFLYQRIRNKRIVADIMGWKETDVRRTYESLGKRIQALKGLV